MTRNLPPADADYSSPSLLKPWELTRDEYGGIVDEIIEAGEQAKVKIKVNFSASRHRQLDEELEAVGNKLRKVNTEFFDANAAPAIARLRKSKNELEPKYEALRAELAASNQLLRNAWTAGGQAMVDVAQTKYPQWIAENAIKIMPPGSGTSGNSFLTIQSYSDCVREALVQEKPVPARASFSLVDPKSSMYMSMDAIHDTVTKIQRQRNHARSAINCVLGQHQSLPALANALTQQHCPEGVSLAFSVVLWDDTQCSSVDARIQDVRSMCVMGEIEGSDTMVCGPWFDFTHNYFTPGATQAAFDEMVKEVAALSCSTLQTERARLSRTAPRGETA